jgi:hypothetical protein
MTGAQALLLGAIVGSAIGVFAGSSHILPALRRCAAWAARRLGRG